MATENEEINIDRATDDGLGGATASSFQNSLTGSSTIQSVSLSEKDIPGASLDGRKPSQLHSSGEQWLKCRGRCQKESDFILAVLKKTKAYSMLL